MNFDQAEFARMSRIVWQRGGYDTLVKVLPFLVKPDGAQPVGRCTTYKHIAGKTPPDIAAMFGLAPRTFTAGAGLFVVAPLPEAEAFEFQGYTPVPGGVGADPPGYVSHPLFQPARGMPVWDLRAVPQSRLVWVTNVVRGGVLDVPVRMIPLPAT
jgi:hypothetical protein